MKTLLLINSDADCTMLTSEGVEEFESVFRYLYDKNMSTDVFQKADKKFMKKLKEFDLNKCDNQEEFLEIFKEEKHFFMEYNLSELAISQRLEDAPDILKIMDENNCNAKKAINKLNRRRLGITKVS